MALSILASFRIWKEGVAMVDDTSSCLPEREELVQSKSYSIRSKRSKGVTVPVLKEVIQIKMLWLQHTVPLWFRSSTRPHSYCGFTHTHSQELCLNDPLEPNLNTWYVGWGAQQGTEFCRLCLPSRKMLSLPAHLSIVPLQEDLFYTGLQNRKEMQLGSQATLLVFPNVTITQQQPGSSPEVRKGSASVLHLIAQLSR